MKVSRLSSQRVAPADGQASFASQVKISDHSLSSIGSRGRVCRARTSGHRDGGKFAHAFSRRHEIDMSFRHFPREKRCPDCLCGEGQNVIRRFADGKKSLKQRWRVEPERVKRAAGVCWLTCIRAEMIATRAAHRCLWQPRFAWQEDLHGHPEFEVIESDPADAGIHFRRITPIYQRRKAFPALSAQHHYRL